MSTIAYKDFSKELKRLWVLVKNVSEERRPIAEKLFHEIVFMDRTLAKLREQVEAEGPISLFKQGKQEFLREHPALTAYNKTIQRMNQTVKQLIDLLPKADSEAAQDDLMDFIK